MLGFLKSGYNLNNPKIEQLVGYDIVNYKVKCNSEKFILKVYPNSKEEIDFAEAENEVLVYLQNHPDNKFPRPVRNRGNKLLTPFTEKGIKKTGRLLTYLEGEFLGDAKHSLSLFKSFGKFLAEMDLQLRQFRNYVIEARQFKWDLQYFLLNEKYVRHIANASNRKIAAYFFQQFKENVIPVAPRLRKQIIHGDANEWNTLTQNEKISGIIDFGDVSHTHLINELAIALAYSLLGKKEPVEWAIPVISEYHKILPLQEVEVDILYWLVAARLCTSVCNSAFERVQRPENSYIQISEKPAWELLRKWVKINPVYARNEFRKAAGFKIHKEKDTAALTAERKKTVSSVFSISYKKPVYMERAAFQYLFDKYGNSYLDAYNNIPHVGHSHPRVVEAGQKQMAKLNTNTRYLYDGLAGYSARLINHFPPPLNKVFLVNSGSAASDLALRLARNFTGKNRVAALEHGYHGNLQSTIEISQYKFAGEGGTGASGNVLCLPIPDVYRGKFSNETAGRSFAKGAIEKINHSNENIAAFIAEPIVGCGGQVPLPKNYLNDVYAATRKQGGVCISDEVQTGFGRLGDVFWGFETHGVVPDIVVLGKPMGNGHPIGAVVTTTEIADAFNNGMEFFSSFGGNPVSCAVGQAVLDVLEEEQLPENAKQAGNYYIGKLKELQKKYECIGDVRGSGLFIGFEFVKNRETLEPDTRLAQKVKNELRNQFILVGTDGPFNNVIKSKPPLCFSKENVDEVVNAVESVLSSQKGFSH